MRRRIDGRAGLVAAGIVAFFGAGATGFLAGETESRPEAAEPAETREPAGAAELPPAFRQIIPRGRIPSVDRPQFVPAADAKIPGEAWVLGIEIDGVAKAYSLNLLNHHEIVNDRFGDLPVAAVW